jgi:glycosyltransferase involved in cell wall biosynthesis
MLSSEKVSIIVPVYNTTEYLPRCIDSILAQTYENLEILLINDGSYDNSGEICDSYAAKDNRIRAVHQENAGVSAARNAGLNAAQGEWLGFVDSDDMILPDMFEKLYTAAIHNNKKISACGFTKHHLNGWKEHRVSPSLPNDIPYEKSIELAMDDHHYDGIMCNKLFHHSIIQGDNPLRLDISIHFCEDLLFVAQALVRADGVAYVSEALYHYYVRQNSAIVTFNHKRITELDARKKLFGVVAHMPKDVILVTRTFYVHSIVNLVRQAAQAGEYEIIPSLRKKARGYLWQYFLFGKAVTSRKLRSAAILIAPRLANFLWDFTKKRFSVTWWSNLKKY